MYVNIHGNKFELNSDNSTYYTGETLIEGLYIDLDDDYIFIPTESMADPEAVLDIVEDECIPVSEIVSYDPNADPFKYIINAMCRYFAEEIDCLNEDM